MWIYLVYTTVKLFERIFFFLKCKNIKPSFILKCSWKLIFYCDKLCLWYKSEVLSHLRFPLFSLLTRICIQSHSDSEKLFSLLPEFYFVNVFLKSRFTEHWKNSYYLLMLRSLVFGDEIIASLKFIWATSKLLKHTLLGVYCCKSWVFSKLNFTNTLVKITQNIALTIPYHVLFEGRI